MAGSHASRGPVRGVTVASRRGNWEALWARLSADSRFGLAGIRQAWLRRQVGARMRLRGLATYDAYLRFLEAHPGELAALAAALRPHVRQALAPAGRRGRAPARRWVDALPVAALLAEASPAGSLRLLACNRPARDLLAAPALALEPASPRHRWLHPDLTPCAAEDLPCQRAIAGGVTSSRTLFLRDDAGRLQPLLVSARRLGAGRPAQAIVTLQPAGLEADQGAGSLLGQFNQVQALCDRYQRLFAESAAPLLVSGPDGTIAEANAASAALLGAAGSLAGSALAGHLSAGTRPALEEALRVALATGEARAQLAPRSRPGQVLEAHARRLATGDGEAVQWALHDISTQAEIERQRGDLTDMVLHDLRSPLATALLGVETAWRTAGHGDGERAQQALAMAQTSLRRLGRLVDSLLDVSRLEAGCSLLHRSPVDVKALLAEVARDVAPLAAASGLRLELQMPASLPTIVADRDMVYRAALNLLDNAIKLSPPQSVIRLRAASDGGGLAISVEDQGPGIAPEFQPRVFDKFVGLQLPHAPRGYGLGLAFCKLAAEAHGGRVAVDSAPGRGSTFTLWFPVGQ